MDKKEIVLSVKDLKVNFSSDNGYVQAVRGVSFDLYKGETLCIVGESGSGKSVTSKAIMGILAANGRVVNGSIMYEGEDLTKVSEDEFHRIRGHKIGMIFQDPLSSLNPIMRIGKQITEAMLINCSKTKKLYEDLVSKELVAYKNAKTELRSGLAKGNENIKFLKAERKKEISVAKNYAMNTIEGNIYTLEQGYGGTKFTIEQTLNDDIEFYKKRHALGKISKKSLKEIVNQLEKRALKNKEKAKAKFEADKIATYDKKDALKEEAREKINEIIAKYEKLIKESKTEYRKNKRTLLKTYRPLIRKTRKAFKVSSKNAKVKVAEFKNKMKEQYYGDLVIIRNKYNGNTDKNAAKYMKAEFKEAKNKYISSLKITKADAKAKALKIMEEVGISEPAKRYRQYPFEFSGGMRQRIVIAIALTADPDVLICDEPTTALDVTIQAQILELINSLKKERDLSCIFITHDLGVVANMADRVAVMYAGKIVEYGKEEEIFYDPKHPYTWALLSSIPDVDSNEKLEAIPGTPPNMIYPPVGDAFALRSKYAMEIDFKKQPPLFKVSDTHYAATWLLDPRAPKVKMPKIVSTRIENSLKNAKKMKGGRPNA